MTFRETNDGFALDLEDASGMATTVSLAHAKQPAQHAETAAAAIREHLDKLGNTYFKAGKINIQLSAPWFVPAKSLNALRREAVAALEAKRSAAYQRPPKRPAAVPPAQYPQSALSYLGNVFNAKARAFYTRHGVSVIDAAYEAAQERNAVSLMVTKHCLRYSFNLCPKQAKGLLPRPMTLIHGKEQLTLLFDCHKCEMQVVGKLKKPRTAQLDAKHIIAYPSR